MKRIKYLSLFAAIALGSLFNAPEATAQNKLVDGSFPAIITPHNQTVSYLERTLCFQITANVPFTTTANSEWISVEPLVRKKRRQRDFLQRGTRNRRNVGHHTNRK